MASEQTLQPRFTQRGPGGTGSPWGAPAPTRAQLCFWKSARWEVRLLRWMDHSRPPLRPPLRRLKAPPLCFVMAFCEFLSLLSNRFRDDQGSLLARFPALREGEGRGRQGRKLPF